MGLEIQAKDAGHRSGAAQHEGNASRKREEELQTKYTFRQESLGSPNNERAKSEFLSAVSPSAQLSARLDELPQTWIRLEKRRGGVNA